MSKDGKEKAGQKEKQRKYEIDPKVEKEIEGALSDEDIIGMYSPDKSIEEKMPLVEKWFPGENQWHGKTQITFSQAIALSKAKNLVKAFPEIKPMAPFIDGVISDYEILLTSVEGVSREQQMKVLRGMFGTGTDDETTTRLAALGTLLSNDGQDND